MEEVTPDLLNSLNQLATQQTLANIVRRLEVIDEKKGEGEEIIISENVVYLYCPNGYGNTKLTNNLFESKLNVVATTRNWKTTNELLILAQQISK